MPDSLSSQARCRGTGQRGDSAGFSSPRSVVRSTNATKDSLRLIPGRP